MRRQRGRVGLMAAALVGLVASGAAADVTTEQSASILVFPKVIADGTRDTIIQITNTSNSMVHAHCFYVNAAPVFPDLPPGPGNPPQWQEIDFDIWLTKQQPTHWVVSTGRLVDAGDARCSNNPPNYACDGAGFDPGRVPPQVEDFTGELKCVEVDASGAPLAGNHLKGEATLVALDRCIPSGIVQGEGNCASNGMICLSNADCPGTTGDVAKYNGLGVIGLETLNDDPVLCLGGEPTDECPLGAEYNACPETWILNHAAYGAPDPVLGEDSSIDTSITIIPCEQNYETQDPTSVTVQFEVYDEFETVFSASTSVTCWAQLELDDISTVFRHESQPAGPIASTYAQTRMRPSSATESGFMVVACENHTYTGGIEPTSGSAAVNLHVEGSRPGPDLIVIPSEQLQQ
jgi:hypothetical protein